jgi:hypothetical protein
MLSITLLAITMTLALIAIILMQAVIPQNKYLAAMREWQTFSAAVVGLAAVVISIVVPNQWADQKASREAQKLETAYLKSLNTSLVVFKQDVESNLAVIRIARDADVTQLTCQKTLEMVRTGANLTVLIDSSQDATFRALPPESYMLLQESLYLQRVYRELISSTNTLNCMTKPEAALENLEDTHMLILQLNTKLLDLISNRISEP